MKGLELLILGGAALLLLARKSEAAATASPQGVAQAAADVIGIGAKTTSGVAPATPSVIPETTEQQLAQITEAVQSGADTQAAAWESKLISMGTPKSAAILNAEIQQGPGQVINTATGGLNAIWTGVGFYNPFTGITHVPTVYS